MWQYEPPASAPVSKTVEIEFGFPKECPGPVSEMGEVEGKERLFDKNGKLVAVANEEDYQLPNYAEAERKAGIAGTMILPITLDANGRVKEIQAASHCRQAWIELPLIWCGRGGLDGWTGIRMYP